MKMLCTWLAVILLVATLTGCSGNGDEPPSSAGGTGLDSTPPAAAFADMTKSERLLEPYDEPVEVHLALAFTVSENINAPADLTPETSYYVEALKRDLNIEIIYDWIAGGESYAAKFDAEIAAGNMPDILWIEALENFQMLYQNGMLGDMTQSWEDYADDDIVRAFNFNGSILDIGMRDGRLYGVTRASHPAQETSQTYYDMNKMSLLGIDHYDALPATIDEFEALADRIMRTDIDGDGLTGEPVLPGNKFYFGAGIFDFSPVFHAHGAWMDGWYADETGGLQPFLAEPTVKDALTTLNRWYEKGFFEKDFAAQDVWGADPKCKAEVLAGEYGVVFGSWWLPNGFIGYESGENWIIGPTLTLNRETPTIVLDRYPASHMMSISHTFEHPEAFYKIAKWLMAYGEYVTSYDYYLNATETDALNENRTNWLWLPIRPGNPSGYIDNFLFIDEKRKSGVTELTPEERDTMWGSWNAYQLGIADEPTPADWGFYLSRLHEHGGIARIYDLYMNANKRYNETYITTATMVEMHEQLQNMLDEAVLSIIVGDIPVSAYDDFLDQWWSLGGRQIKIELDEWYQSNGGSTI